MKNHIKKLKAYKKILADKIRKMDKSLQYEKCMNSMLFRHIHIADCLLRGRDISQIENKNREGNEPNKSLYEYFMNTEEPSIPLGFHGFHRTFFEPILNEIEGQSNG